jgi:hypothetical protein
MEHKERRRPFAERARQGEQCLRVFLDRIADKDHRAHRVLVHLAQHVAQHGADLSHAALAAHLRHQTVQSGGAADPAAGAALVVTAVVNELNHKPSGVPGIKLGDRVKQHMSDMTSAVPGRLAARGGIEREDQPAGISAGGATGLGTLRLQRLEIGGDITAPLGQNETSSGSGHGVATPQNDSPNKTNIFRVAFSFFVVPEPCFGWDRSGQLQCTAVRRPNLSHLKTGFEEYKKLATHLRWA